MGSKNFCLIKYGDTYHISDLSEINFTLCKAKIDAQQITFHTFKPEGKKICEDCAAELARRKLTK